MATYNGEKFISEQIESILNQTLKPDEIVISDDASTDQTLKILLEYQKQYPNLIKVISNKNNAGFVKNFERALLNVTGDFIALSDQDDVWVPEKLQEEYNILEKNPNVGLVFSDLELVDEHLNKIGTSMWKLHKWQLDGYIKGVDFFENILRSNRVTGCTIMIRKSVIANLIPFYNRINLHDYWLALGASLLSDVFAIDRQLVLYRQHSSNQTGAGIKIKWITLTYDQYMINLQKEKDTLYRTDLFYEFLFEFVKQHSKNEFLILKVKKIYKFHRARLELYSSQHIFTRITIGFGLLLRLNFYPEKLSVLKDFTMVFSSKIRASKLYFCIVSKLKNRSIQGELK
jgi:glycosyltransferase involved in cell wall biosynthesis